MVALVPDPGFPATCLILALPGQPVIKEDLMDGIMRYMDAMFVFDYLLEASCAQILLSVDALTTSKLPLMLISETSRIKLTWYSSSTVFFRPAFLYGQQLVIFSPVDPYSLNCGLANFPFPCNPLCALVIDLISDYAFDLSLS